MAEKISDDQVADLLKVVRSDASVDNKVQHVNGVKSSIKQHNVPDYLVPQVAEGLRTASASQHGVLVNAGFTALNHLLTRLSRQEPKLLSREVKATLPLVMDKLGDQKEKFRSLASQALTTLYGIAPAEVERLVRNGAMAGKNPRAKEAGMQWLLQMHQEHGLQFRGYVPTLMDLLEDADGMVRDAAKSTVIELFRNAPNAAKSDLKRQLKNFKVRPAIEQAIVKALAPTAGARPDTPSDAAPAPEPARAPSRANLAASVSSLSTDRPVTPAPEVKTDGVEPLYVNTQRELDDSLREMHLYFDGKETEQNWLKREESIIKLRRFIAGNVPQDLRDPFLVGAKALLDGIIKAITSLRTSLSKEGCALVQDIAVAFGPGMDPLVELLMQTLIKLSAATKKISSQLANTTVDVIISRVTYNNRLLQHIWGACQDKNVQPRSYATGWLKTLLKREGHHKSHIEHTGGLDVIEKGIKKGLNDANPGVREKMRGTYWFFASIWPARAEVIMENLDSNAQKLLNKDPNNPNSTSSKPADPAPRPGMGLSKSTMTASKPSLRETMLAQKRAMASQPQAKNLPARPGSAMAHISPTRNVSGSSNASAASAATSSKQTTRTRPESTTVSGGMSVRPMRPAKRRPDIAPRPATAGPYSVRSQPGAEAPSPESLKGKTPTSKPNLEANPRRTAPKPRPGHASHASESSLPSPGGKTPGGTQRAPGSPSVGSPRLASPRPASRLSSPRVSTPKLKQSHTEAAPVASPQVDSEDITLLVPSISKQLSPEPEPEPAAQPPSSPPQPDAPAVEQEPQAAPDPTPESTPAVEPALKEQQVPAETEAPVAETTPKASPARPTPVKTTPPKEASATPVSSKTIQVFEDPFTGEQQQSSASKPIIVAPALEVKSVNENVPANVHDAGDGLVPGEFQSPEKSRQNAKLLESGIKRIKARTLDVHGFRKLQTLIREGRADFSSGRPIEGAPENVSLDKFEALSTGLFEFLESPLGSVAPEKAQDVKAQVLATIKLLLRNERERFGPHVCRGLEALVSSRGAYDARTHIVSGLELLAEELVTIGEPAEVVATVTGMLRNVAGSGSGSGANDKAVVEGNRSLTMGLHVLKELLDKRESFVPAADENAEDGQSGNELAQLARLAGRCLESSDSGVRMGAVQLCVALHAKIGDGRFWEAVRGAKDDPKNLITYYIAKRQREAANVGL